MIDVEKLLNGQMADPLIKSDDTIYVPESLVDEKKKVTILGAVKSPGSYENHLGMTLLKLIAVAGDITADADIYNVRIFRENKNHVKDVLKVNLEKVLTGMEKDIGLNDSDVVSIINKKFISGQYVTLVGQVTKPGAYLYREGLSLMGLVALAADFKDTANRGNIKIVRQEGEETKVYKVNAQKVLHGKAPDFILKANDMIYVSESLF
jgi:polysaccharide export outer membrane protein